MSFRFGVTIVVILALGLCALLYPYLPLGAAAPDIDQQLADAASRGAVADISDLLGRGANPAVPGLSGLSAIEWTAYRGDRPTLKRLLATRFKAPRRLVSAALVQAAMQGHAGCLRLLLDKGAIVRGRGGQGGIALAMAAERGHTDICEILLDCGADREATNNILDGRTALMAAARGGHTATVRLLLARGARVNARASDGRTALTLAREANHPAVAALLLRAGGKE